MCQSFPLPRRHRLPLPRRLPQRLLHPRQPLHRFLHLPQSRRPHRQQGHHRLHRRQNPWLRSPPRVTRELHHEGYEEMPGRTRGETRAIRDASREYAYRHGLLSMPHWCRCWLPGTRSTRLFVTIARRTNRRTCQLHLCRKFTPRQAYLRWRHRCMRTYGVARWTDNYMACYKPVLLHRYSNQSTT